MTMPNTELPRQGGRFNASLGMLLTTQDVAKMGELGIQSLLHFLMLFTYDDEVGQPASGFPRSDLGAPNAEITQTGNLTYTVGQAWGLVYDSSLVGSDEFGSAAYQMVVLDALTIGPALAAHDATLPRNDLIALQPVRVEDQAATRNIKDPTSGALSTSSVALRNRFSSQIVVITGTPNASPVDPALPNGHLLVARALVPATAGAATLLDARPVLHIGPMLGGPNSGQAYLRNHVHPTGASNELEVTETAPTSTSVQVARGRAVIDGVARFHPYEVVTPTAAHATLSRFDVVVANRNGTLSVVAGVAGGGIPAIGANQIPLASLLITAASGVLTNALITDQRIRSWSDGKGVRKGTLSHEAMITPPWRVELTGITTPDVDVKRLDYKIVYPDGTLWDGTFPLDVMVETYFVDPSQTIFAAAGYNNTNGSDRYRDTNHMLVGLAASMLVFPYLGIENQSSVDSGGAIATGCSTGRWRGKVTAATFSVELCRPAGGGATGDYYFAVVPAGPDGAPLGLAQLDLVSF